MAAVASMVKEVGRQMKSNPQAFYVYQNSSSPKLPNIKGGYYIEADVPMGTAKGRGQYRVVCAVNNKHQVVKKYYSPTHYGTGSDARKKPSWIEFR